MPTRKCFMWNFVIKYMSKYLKSSFSFFDNQHQIYTYENIIELVKSHGKRLNSIIPPGCKCAIVCDCEFYTAVSLLAAWYAKLIPIPMSKNYGKIHCDSILNLTTPDVIIVDNDSDFCDSNLTVYNIKNLDFINLKEEYNCEDCLDDIALIMCTSGTTGIPKGVMITVEGLISNIIAISGYFEIDETDTIMILRPLYHCAVMTGEFLISLMKGVNIVFSDAKYNPNKVLDYIKAYNITVICGTPTLLRQISMFIERSKVDILLKSIVISGECLTTNTAIRLQETFRSTKIYNVYGLTELSPRVSYLPPDKFYRCLGSVGIALQGVVINVINDDGDIVKPFDKGYIIVKSISVMKGYYNNIELTNMIKKKGWLFTGDIGYKDDEGNLYVLSRSDDMIIKGGMNIYPQEIENRILELGEVAECRVSAFLFEETQELSLELVLKEDYKNLSMKKLRLLINSILPRYQIPAKIIITDEINKTVSGKIIRNKAAINNYANRYKSLENFIRKFNCE